MLCMFDWARLLFVVSCTIGSHQAIPDEQRLLTKLMRNYDNAVRPVINASQNIVVNFGFTLIQIMDMVRLNVY